jgi:hypothetical protein
MVVNPGPPGAIASNQPGKEYFVAQAAHIVRSKKLVRRISREISRCAVKVDQRDRMSTVVCHDGLDARLMDAVAKPTGALDSREPGTAEQQGLDLAQGTAISFG